MSASKIREALRLRLVFLPGVMTTSKAFAALATSASGFGIGATLYKPGGPRDRGHYQTHSELQPYYLDIKPISFKSPSATRFNHPRLAQTHFGAVCTKSSARLAVRTRAWRRRRGTQIRI